MAPCIRRTLFCALFLLAGIRFSLYPVDSGFSGGTGEPAMAERYALWAKDALDRGLWGEALAGLERASDFAGVSSDISYLLALARSRADRPLGTVLEALERALAVDRWNMYGPEAARLMRAGILVTVKAYPEALAGLSRVSESPASAVLTLRALAASRPWGFLPYLSETLDRFPREGGPVRVFFSFLKNGGGSRYPEGEALQLLELVIRRLPILVLNDPELAWMAAPFMRDTAEAGRMVQAYRAAHVPVPASIPAALRLGVIDEERAIEDLFAFTGEALPSGGKAVVSPHSSRAEPPGSPPGTGLLSEIWGLLRHEGARSLFRRNLSAYTGVITSDGDMDGIPEISAEYSSGMLVSYTYDADQDGSPGLVVYFEAGDPRRARVEIPPEGASGREAAELRWERYPALLSVELNGVRYIPRPLEFHYSPLVFDALWGSGLLFPRRDPLSPPLTRRVLVSSVLRVERPSLEFKEAVETVELAGGIPVGGREYTGGRMVSETEFVRGRPQLQRVDLDLDGRMETVRRFRRGYRTVELEDLWDYDRDIEFAVSDWDGDGVYEARDPEPES